MSTTRTLTLARRALQEEMESTKSSLLEEKLCKPLQVRISYRSNDIEFVALRNSYVISKTPSVIEPSTCMCPFLFDFHKDVPF